MAFFPSSARKSRRKPHQARLVLEQLEDRTLLATLALVSGGMGITGTAGDLSNAYSFSGMGMLDSFLKNLSPAQGSVDLSGGGSSLTLSAAATGMSTISSTGTNSITAGTLTDPSGNVYGGPVTVRIVPDPILNEHLGQSVKIKLNSSSVASGSGQVVYYTSYNSAHLLDGAVQDSHNLADSNTTYVPKLIGDTFEVGLFLSASAGPGLEPPFDDLHLDVSVQSIQLTPITFPQSSVAAGDSFDVKISANDPEGLVTTFNRSVTIAIASQVHDFGDDGTLGGTLTVNAVNGVADFPDLTIDKPGAYVLQASSPDTPFVATMSEFFVTSVTSVTKLVVTSQPPSQVPAGGKFDVKISAADAQGNVDTTFNGDVTIALANNPGSSTLGGTLTVAAVNGVADFPNLTLDHVGTGYTLQATAPSWASATTHAFDVIGNLAITVQPPTTVAPNEQFHVKVAAKDADGNVDTSFNGSVTIGLAANPGGSTLGGTVTVSAVNGVADFSNLTLDQSGIGYTLQATSTGWNSATTAPPFDVIGLAPTSLVWDKTLGGFDFGYQIRGVDLPSDTAVGFYWASSTIFDGGAPLYPASLTWPTGTAVGIYDDTPAHNIPSSAMTTPPAGTKYLLEVTDPFNLITDWKGKNVKALKVPSMEEIVDGAVSVVTRNSPAPNPTIAPGVIRAYFVPKLVTLDTAAKLGGFDHFNWVQRAFPPLAPAPFLDPPPVGGIAGAAFFGGRWVDNFDYYYNEGSLGEDSINIHHYTHSAAAPNAATYYLDFYDQPALGIVAGTISHIDFTTSLVGVVAGNTYKQLYTWTWSSNFTPTLGSVLGDLGLFKVRLSVPDDEVSGSGEIYNLQRGLLVEQATQLAIAPSAENLVTNVRFTVSVAALDSQGIVDPTFTGSVTLTLANNPGNSTLGGALTVNAVNGVATFSDLTLDNPGRGCTLQASSGSLTPGLSSPFDVVPDQLVVTTQPPASVTAGTAFQVVIAAKDGAGNVDTTFNGSVTVTAPPGVGLNGALSLNAVNGVATFTDLTINQAGTYALFASSSGLAPASTGNFVVVAAPATQFVISSQPTSRVTASANFGLQVTAHDSYGNPDPAFTGNVTIALASNPGGATLGGTLTLAAVNGVADFSGLTLDQTGSGYTIQASNGSLNGATTNAFDVTGIGVATQLVVTTQPPPSVAAATGFGLVLSARDSFGTLDPSFSGSVTITLESALGLSAPLGGTTTATAVNGVATFSGLTVERTGNYLLSAGSTGLTGASSNPFTVAPGSVTHLEFTTAPQTLTAGDTKTVTVEVADAFGNPVQTSSGGLTLTLSTTSTAGTFLNAAGQPLAGNSILIGEGSTAVSFKYRDTKAGTPTLTVTATGNSPITQQHTVNPASASRLGLLTAAQTLPTGQSSAPITVQLLDAFGNVVEAGGGGVTVGLNSTSAMGTFLDAAGAPLSGNTISIAPGTSTASFKYSDTVGGTPTLTMAASGVLSATQQETIVWPAPQLSNVPAVVSISEGAAYTFTATTNAPGAGQTFTFSLIGAPSGASIQPSTGVFTWTPAEPQGPGSYPFTVRVSDGATNTDANITIAVAEVNVAPSLVNVPSSVTAVRGTPMTFTASAADPDLIAGQPNQLTFSLVDPPSGATIDPNTGIFTWTPDENLALGQLSFTVQVADNGFPSFSATQTVDVDVVQIALLNGDLLLSGTTGNDIITVKPVTTDTSKIDVVLNGASLGQFDLASITSKIGVYGLSGNDRITIASTITKNAELVGGAGKDTLVGGAGNDTLDGGAGNDRLAGGKGDDTYVFADSWGVDAIVEAAKAGNDRMDFSAATADLTFTVSGNGSVAARNGTNSVAGIVESINAGMGNDRFIFRAGGRVAGAIDGGGGSNTLDCAAYATSVKVNLLLGMATGTGGLSNVANVTGGRGNDILVGNAAANVLLGNGGRDLLIGGGGADSLDGGAGDDILVVGATDSDNNPTNLDAMMAAWANRVLPYATRISNLASLLSASTVHDDSGDVDSLSGGLGLDWFLISTGDEISDQDNGGTETTTTLSFVS